MSPVIPHPLKFACSFPEYPNSSLCFVLISHHPSIRAFIEICIQSSTFTHFSRCLKTNSPTHQFSLTQNPRQPIWFILTHLFLLPAKFPLYPSLLLLCLCFLTVLPSPEQFMPDEWGTHARGMKSTADHIVNRNACCLPVCSRIEASQPNPHTHKSTSFISLCAEHSHGTCVGIDMGQSASSTTRRWAFWSTGKYIHHGWWAQRNIFLCKLI